jgi:TonB family protein
MARQSQLEGRLLSILDSGVRRGAVRRLAPLVAALAAVAVVAPFAALEAQEKPKPILPPEIDATILAANSQKNHELLDQAASAYIFLQKYEVAQTLLEDALKIRGEVSGQRSGPYAAGLVKLADLLEKRQQTDQAVDLYNRAVAIGDLPEVAPALYRLGIFKYRENPAAARDLFEHAVRLNPKGPSAGPATTWLAVLRASDAGGAGDAETLFQQALRLEDPNSLDAANTLNLYARFLTLQNRQSEAEPLLAQAAAITKTRFAGFPTDLPTFRAITRGPGGDVMPPQQAQASSALKVGNGVTAPRLLYKFEPEYTEEARAAKWQGTVLLFIEVTPDGIAENIRVLRSAGLGLDEKAVEAVKRWKFAPGAKEGVPVTVQAQIEVNFRLQ